MTVSLLRHGFSQNGQITHSWADGLVSRVMPDGKIRMLQRLFAGDALRRIKVQHLGEQIKGEWVRVRKQLRKRHPRPDGQRTDIILGLERVEAVVSNKTKVSVKKTYPG